MKKQKPQFRYRDSHHKAMYFFRTQEQKDNFIKKKEDEIKAKENGLSYRNFIDIDNEDLITSKIAIKILGKPMYFLHSLRTKKQIDVIKISRLMLFSRKKVIELRNKLNL